MSKLDKILLIGGSDSSGNAGIQADITTIAQLGGNSASVITAITSQNDAAVTDILPVPAETIKSQIEAAFDCANIDVIKTGMLVNKEIIEAINLSLTKAHPPLIIDPVLQSTSGVTLLDDDGLECLKKTLLPLAFLVTPNIPEAEELSGMSITSDEDSLIAGKKIIDMYRCNAVLVKGGHGVSDIVCDILITHDDVSYFKNKRIKGSFRGTGCRLASAISLYLSEGNNLHDSVMEANSYVREYLEQALSS